MTLRGKMLLLSIAAIVGFTLIIVGTYFSLERLNQAQTAYVQQSNAIRSSLEIKASAFATIQLDPTTAATAAIFSTSEANIATYLDKLRQHADGERATQIAQIGTLWLQYDKDSQRLIALAKTDAKSANDQLMPLYEARFKPLQSAIETFVAQNNTQADAALKGAESAQSSVLWIVISPLVLFGVALVAFVAVISIGLGRSLGGIIAALERLGTGKLTTRLPVIGNDELTAIARAVNRFVELAQQMVREVQAGSHQVTEAADELSDTSRQIAEGSNMQSEVAASMAASVEQVSVSINHVAANASDALHLSNVSGQVSLNGGQIIDSAVAEMNKIAAAVGTTSEVIVTLGRESEQISVVVGVIKEVADQTNLLALNAAIEAARAGEQGRGFAVVADEVRKLAERTTNSTKEIAAVVDKIQASTQDAVLQMAQVVANVAAGQRLADEAGQCVRQIQSEAEKVQAAVGEISSSLNEQSIASNQIASSVEKVAQMTEENSASAKGASHAAQALAAIATQMRATADRFEV